MSGGRSCKCSEKSETIEDRKDSNRPGRLWRITQYKCNHSAFNGYHHTSSAYSAITCLRCGAVWRTKAPYVDKLSMIKDDERYISRGYDAHEAAMEARDRLPLLP